MKRLILVCAIGLAGCGSWPDTGAPRTAAAGGDWPKLLPLDQVLEGGTVEVAEDADARALSRRAAALRARANVLRGNTSDMEALRARLAR